LHVSIFFFFFSFKILTCLARHDPPVVVVALDKVSSLISDIWAQHEPFSSFLTWFNSFDPAGEASVPEVGAHGGASHDVRARVHHLSLSAEDNGSRQGHADVR
jgi:hypothetical protein